MVREIDLTNRLAKQYLNSFLWAQTNWLSGLVQHKTSKKAQQLMQKEIKPQ